MSGLRPSPLRGLPLKVQEADNRQPRGGAMTPETRHKPQVAIMNAVHDLPVLVARDKGFFRDEGLDLEFVTTPGMAQVTTSQDRKSTRLNSSHGYISYAVFCLKKKKKQDKHLSTSATT